MSDDLIRRFAAYSQAAQTLPKTKQIVMLYEGMVRFMMQAREAIEKGDIEQRYLCIAKTAEVISGLHSSIDFNQGGSIARVLDGFYSSIFADLSEIQKTNSIAKCDQVIGELKEMCKSWAEIDKMQSSSSSSPASGSAPASSSAVYGKPAPAGSSPAPTTAALLSTAFSV